MRDAIFFPINQEEMFVITSDNSGGVGRKEQDIVKADYDLVGYYSFRVSVMECMAVGAQPIAVVLQNFCGDDSWDPLVRGIQRGLQELEMTHIPITGSTESNFSLCQSAVGMLVIGRKFKNGQTIIDDKSMALIGLPLVGEEVLSQTDAVVPLSVFKKICTMGDVIVWPVGSKGVLHELERMMPGRGNIARSCGIDVLKSGGPSTSFLVAYPLKQESTIKEIAGNHFHKLG